MNKQLTFLLSLTFLISFSGSVYGDEYNEALNKWKLAAEQGKVKAQYNLGVMYAVGQGVTKNDKESNKCIDLLQNKGIHSHSSSWEECILWEKEFYKIRKQHESG